MLHISINKVNLSSSCTAVIVVLVSVDPTLLLRSCVVFIYVAVLTLCAQ